MKRTIKWSLLALVLSVSACVTPSQITYIKDMEYGKDYPAKPAPELKVQQMDRLSIRVYSSDPDLAKPFNVGAIIQDGVGTTQEATYLVDSQGNIDFPVLGTIPVEGMTLREVQRDIANRIIGSGYIREPVVSVNLQNFTVTLVKYGTSTPMTVAGRSINLLQVVAPTNGEKIKEVEVIRTENGVRKAYSVDFQTIEMFDSPVFYLQQNDIVYVKPARWMRSQTGQAIQQSITMMMTFANMAANILVWTRLAK
ncbi:MAG: polysaccharide biosynthesis/export family protein [Bacteroidales bacterium]|nr:polysaccharide biosynthesis/export family protein [Bacteroidales bacterium]